MCKVVNMHSKNIVFLFIVLANTVYSEIEAVAFTFSKKKLRLVCKDCLHSGAAFIKSEAPFTLYRFHTKTVRKFYPMKTA